MWSPSRKQAVTSATWSVLLLTLWWQRLWSELLQASYQARTPRLRARSTQQQGLGHRSWDYFYCSDGPGWRRQPVLLCHGDYCGLRLLWLLTVIVTLLLTRSSNIPTSGYWSGVLSMYVNSTFPPGPLHPQHWVELTKLASRSHATITR